MWLVKRLSHSSPDRVDSNEAIEECNMQGTHLNWPLPRSLIRAYVAPWEPRWHMLQENVLLQYLRIWYVLREWKEEKLVQTPNNGTRLKHNNWKGTWYFLLSWCGNASKYTSESGHTDAGNPLVPITSTPFRSLWTNVASLDHRSTCSLSISKKLWTAWLEVLSALHRRRIPEKLITLVANDGARQNPKRSVPVVFCILASL